MENDMDTTAMTDDELLSAYLDGELPEAAANALTERLAAEPGLLARLEAMRGSDAATRALFAKVDELPLPESVLALVQEDSLRDVQGDNVVALPRRGLARFMEAPVAIAAAVALVAGFLGSQLLAPQTDASLLAAGQVPSGSALHALLEEAPSAAARDLGDGSRGEVVLTFAATDGRWCRQLRVSGTQRVADALACRDASGWQTEAVSYGLPASGAFQTASGAPPAAIEAAIERLLNAGDILNPDTEQSLIENDWKSLKSAE